MKNKIEGLRMLGCSENYTTMHVKGLYMEPDPIGLEGGLNPYAYAGNNPVMNTDPSGLYMDPMDNFAMGNTFASPGINIDFTAMNQSMNNQMMGRMQALTDQQMSNVTGQGICGHTCDFSSSERTSSSLINMSSIVGSSAQVVAGAVGSATGWGAPVGIPISAIGMDNLLSTWYQVPSMKETYLRENVSQNYGGAINSSVNLATGVYMPSNYIKTFALPVTLNAVLNINEVAQGVGSTPPITTPKVIRKR